MSKTVFDLGLSVEAVSLYLLIEGLAGNKIDPDKNCTAKSDAITRESCVSKWNGEKGDFESALQELKDVGAIVENGDELKITNPTTWKTKQV